MDFLNESMPLPDRVMYPQDWWEANVEKTLEVRESNARAQAMYAKLGFVRVGRRKKYYEDNGEDAWLMVCDRLPPAEEDFTDWPTGREKEEEE